MGGQPCPAAALNGNLPLPHRLLAILLASGMAACGGPPGQAEIVLCPGSSVTVAGAQGPLTVRATSLITRAYRVEDFDFAADLIPRWRRWNGNHGLYRPAAGGDTHAVLEEGQQFFSNEEELYDWIEWAKRWGGELHYTSDGLLVHWATRRRGAGQGGPRRSLAVDVVQLMLDGGKPRALGGSDDAAFAIRQPPSGACRVGAAMRSQFVASDPATVGAREYAGWALDVMKAHGITAEDVERTIAEGRADRFEGHITYVRGQGGPDWREAFKVRTDSRGKVLLVFY